MFFVGVDVGTASVRAGLYSLETKTFEKKVIQPISVNRVDLLVETNPSRTVEGISQSSEEIWLAVCKVVREVVSETDPNLIKGVGFDATCSLVVLGENDQSLPVNTSPDHLKNAQIPDVILWMDHRAKDETDDINMKLAGHRSLDFVGGKVSLEMQVPKLIWLKKHLPDTFRRATKFMDLADFLAFKASGDASRSFCTAVCKWLYQIDPKDPASHGWDCELFKTIGLDDLDLKRIGERILLPGTSLGHGVTSQAAVELGLNVGTAVATGLIDAHAGGLALAFCRILKDTVNVEPYKRLGLICGTSTCFMICNENPKFIPGVWGPYYSAMIPNSWLNEAGQSASGQFLDQIVSTHPFYLSFLKDTEQGEMTACYEFLNKRAEEIRIETQSPNVGFLSDTLHIFPDFHGNRSPLANPDFKGMILGLTLDCCSERSLIRIYIAALQALAYESRWIIDTIVKTDIFVQDVALCGGLSKNSLFVQTLADVIRRPVVLPEITESVLLGSAILAATASGHFKDLRSAAVVMAGSGRLVLPDLSTEQYHTERHRTFLKMAEFQSKILSPY